MKVGIEEPEWAQGIIKYLNIGELPANKKEIKFVKRKVTKFAGIDGVLYKKNDSSQTIEMSWPTRSLIFAS